MRWAARLYRGTHRRLPHATNVEYYARIVREKSTLRNLIFSANKILANAYEAEQEPNLILDEAEQAIFAIAEDRVREGFVSMRTLAHAELRDHREGARAQAAHHRRAVRLHRSRRAHSRIPAGRSRSSSRRAFGGKTALALNIAQHVGTKTGNRGHVQPGNVEGAAVSQVLTSEAHIDSHRLRTGFLVESDWGRLSHALGTLSETKIYIDDSPGMGVLEMRAKSRRLLREHGLDMLMIDYIQLMQGRGRFENRTLELASISRSLKQLAKELNVPDHHPFAVEPRARIPRGSPADALRPARIGRPRAGR